MSDTFDHEADAWEDRIGREEHGDDPDPRDPVTCKFCGADDVEWIHTGVRWRLFDSEAMRPHVCRNDCTADDFGVVA